MRRCGSISSPLAAGALLLVVLVVAAGCSHCATASRLLPPSSSVPVPALVHQENGVTAAAGAAGGGGGLVVLQEGGVGNGDELSASIPEMVGADQGVAACEELGNEEEEECMQRRLLHEAHLDYIYTQHKGRP